MSRRLKSDVLLFLTALIWGSALVAQKVGSDVGAFTFNGIRIFLGGLFLIPILLIRDSRAARRGDAEERSLGQKTADRRLLLRGGTICGIAFFCGTILQQYGVHFTTAGNAGFITTLYTVIVPFLSIAVGKKVRRIMWLCVPLSVVGLYLLTMTPGEPFHLQRGDFFVLISAFAFSGQIMLVDYFSERIEPVRLSCVQFLVAGAIGIVGMFLFEDPRLRVIMKYPGPILYAGIVSCGIGCTMQVMGQKDANPTEASLILCLESVFSALSGALFLQEKMSGPALIGCAMIFGATLLSQLPAPAASPEKRS